MGGSGILRYGFSAFSAVKHAASRVVSTIQFAKFVKREHPDAVLAETVPVGDVATRFDFGAPVILDVHGLSFEQKLVELANSGPEARMWYHIQRRALMRADHIVVVSGDMKNYLGGMISPTKMTVVPNGAYPQPLEARYSRPCRMLFSGIFEYWEAPLVLAEIAEKLPAGLCCAMGSGSLLETVLQRSPKLRYLGSFPHAKALYLSSQYQIGLVPSSDDIARHVAFPIKMLDYFSVGLPAAVASVGGWSKLVDELDAGWRLNPNSFTEEVQFVEAA